MIKFNLIILLYLIILLNIQCVGKPIRVELKIKDDWEEKREFIYLKNIELKERFVLIMNVNQNNRIGDFFFKKNGSFFKIEVNQDNVFIIELNNASKYINQLKQRSLIEIANNQIIQQFLPKLKNRRDIENYKNKLLSNYWTEINLIGYKIELLRKQKVEYSEELKSKIIYIGNKIEVTNEKRERDCFNCSVKQTKTCWQKYLKEHYLCHTCGDYNQKFGKHRHKSLFIKTKKNDRHCNTCRVIHSKKWYRQKEPGGYLCHTCYIRQYRIKMKANKN
uniref:GATA-type domain-containing protein n=1 Tax=Meloidogyne enterolobii TaxID=390850 RepID=A0A6V7UPE4_MELEN|nr:unnamed protein product [Meloidogyne enterolobii]